CARGLEYDYSGNYYDEGYFDLW
nr:immunoglobulin heavy chain junction region [Macaca mulatta]MOV51986.1 immunoglobulin heavy chain junction region [Macaca mulatta]